MLAQIPVRRRRDDSDLGSLGSILVGVLVLVAIGGAYSLRSYPIPKFLGSSTSHSQEVTDAMVLQALQEACVKVVEEAMGTGGETVLPTGSMTPAEFKILLAFFGQRDLQAKDPATVQAAILPFVEANAHRLNKPELIKDVNCDVFAENLMHFGQSLAAVVAPPPDYPMQRGMLGSSSTFLPGFLNLSRTINLFGIWLHKALRTVVVNGMKILPGGSFYAPRRKRGLAVTDPAPSCLGCFSCHKS
mmetsp:Transcript_23650/g.57284  ORF Transcript_23650/g.57284 Transcript_23650/m.57284 type:complete len:245 (-) Transcript_23650:410-1144(-)|eukprot:CAMPEP_0114528846 /NCGR_PEP_ID=MMETSP0109-20121206/24475_1 /TAXON_ID=29199 /ORGANISM="Chlorarachnion reptans, Strain CCCM449" /LENGTH=244 /DNA_ID=CAMNT_0001711121 /DNA_START=397 /DNA_END=1131 /DNA_ORIENTATION=+